MEICYTIQRPSLPLTPACAPSAAMPIITADQWAPLSQAHQVQIQPEPARVRALGDRGNGTAGFRAGNVFSVRNKFSVRNVFSVRKGFVGSTGLTVKVAAGGVPPRGRPV